MDTSTFTTLETNFYERHKTKGKGVFIPYIVVENFPQLGLITALRFLEWVAENPDGVISLPTGKTPEYFIKWVNFLLEHWDDDKGQKLLGSHGLGQLPKPEMKDLHFVQIDEFYPIDPAQHNSFFHYVNKYYIEG